MFLTRDKFREGCLKRDNYSCIICHSKEDLSVHHIIERRLWGDTQGYCLSNGSTLCPKHHIEAEQTILTCEKIREAAGIKEIVLPEHFYIENRVDKWGNIILPNGNRLKGELFFDESVQKILKSGNVLDSFIKYIKYPRTFHLPWSGKVSKDDRILDNTKYFEGKNVVVSLKMDGENTSYYKDYFHARSIDGQSHPSQTYIKNLHAKISYNIPEDWRFCGENLYAKHSIEYNNLESYFLLFSIWNEKNECLSWDETLEWSELVGLKTVPVIYEGIWDEDIIKNFINKTEYNGDPVEGYVVRIRDKFKYIDFKNLVAKYVSVKFRLNINNQHNWRNRSFTVNKIKKIGAYNEQ